MRQPRSASISATSSATMPPPITATPAPSGTSAGSSMTSQACSGAAPGSANDAGRARPRAGRDDHVVGGEGADRRGRRVDAAAHAHAAAIAWSQRQVQSGRTSSLSGAATARWICPPGRAAFSQTSTSWPRLGGEARDLHAAHARTQDKNALALRRARQRRFGEFRRFEFRSQHRIGHAGDVAFQREALEADIAGDAQADRHWRFAERLARPMRIRRQRATERDIIPAPLASTASAFGCQDAPGDDGRDLHRIGDWASRVVPACAAASRAAGCRSATASGFHWCRPRDRAR